MVQKENTGLINQTGKSGWKKSALGIAAAIVGGIIVYLIMPDVLANNARALAGIFVAVLVLWITEALPAGLVALVSLALTPLFGVYADMKSATVGFYGFVPYFVIASFILSFAVEKSGVGRRFALWLLSKTGTRSKIAVLVFMFGTASTSAIMSDVPSCAIWMSLAMPILNNLNVTVGKSNLGKALMIGIPVAALIGGVATPAGSSINILALQVLKTTGNMDITFLQWMALGVPMFLIMTVVAWWVLVHVFKPEVDTIGDVSMYQQQHKDLGKWSSSEIKTIVIMAIALFFWVASSWIKGLDISMVAILAAGAMMLPGMNLFKWSEAEGYIGWSTFLVIGAVTSLGLATVSTGLSAWVVQNVLSGLGSLSLIAITLIIGIFTVFIHIPIPINPAIITAILPPMIILAQDTGVNPAIYALPIAFTTSVAFMLPLDSVTLVTYSKGYYTMRDMILPGAIISLIWVGVMTVVTLTIAPMLGFM